MLLKATPVVQQLTLETKQWLEENKKLDCYVAIFLLSDNLASEKYVSLKAAYAKKLGIYADILFGKDWDLEEVLEEMRRCNEDEKCLGVMVQLPLADHLREHQETILEAIDPKKDIDGLTSATFGTMSFGYTSLLGATPTSALMLLDGYDLGEMVGKNVLIISQSNLIGKRLAVGCMHRKATILSANSRTSQEHMRTLLEMADIVFSATGSKHLINETLMSKSDAWKEKIFIDIGRGSDEDGAYGDIDRRSLQDKVQAITPVPGGVGPATVACLFWNIILLAGKEV